MKEQTACLASGGGAVREVKPYIAGLDKHQALSRDGSRAPLQNWNFAMHLERQPSGVAPLGS